jgi:hypothetical protein
VNEFNKFKDSSILFPLHNWSSGLYPQQFFPSHLHVIRERLFPQFASFRSSFLFMLDNYPRLIFFLLSKTCTDPLPPRPPFQVVPADISDVWVEVMGLFIFSYQSYISFVFLQRIYGIQMQFGRNFGIIQSMIRNYWDFPMQVGYVFFSKFWHES